jgi:hypothetical protein
VARYIPAAALLSFLLGCAPSPDHRPAPDTQSSARTLDRNESTAVTLTLLQRIGDVSGEPPSGFGSIRGLAVDATDRLWVLDGKALHVVVLDRHGRPVRVIGRPGSGPGEFRQPAALLRDANDLIWIDDPGNARLVQLDSGGRVAQTRVLPRVCMQARPWPARFDTMRRYIGIGGADCHLVVRFDTQFVEEHRAEAPVDRRPLRLIQTRSGSVAVPFAGDVVWHPGRDSTVWALQTDCYRISELSLDGDTLRSQVIPFEREPLSAADKALAFQFLDEAAKDGADTRSVSLPSTKPAAVSFFIADDGMIWVERYTEPDQLGTLWEIIDPVSLRRTQAIRSPVPLARFPTPVVRSRRVYAATEDSAGIPQVAVLRW